MFSYIELAYKYHPFKPDFLLYFQEVEFKIMAFKSYYSFLVNIFGKQ